MEKKLVGRFYGVRFDNLIYGFNVYSNGKIVCPNVSDKEFSKIVLKPRFKLINDKNGIKYCRNYMNSNAKNNEELIKEYIIDPALLHYMVKTGMAFYSVDMAIYYGLDLDNAYDRDATGSPFKWASKKGKVLVKQKQGVFN